jgi:hypothetical protein
MGMGPKELAEEHSLFLRHVQQTASCDGAEESTVAAILMLIARVEDLVRAVEGSYKF